MTDHSDKSENTIDFSMLLASSVHDIKNSLGMLMNSLDEMTADTDHGDEQRNSFSILRGEASRINNAMIHLLSLYRLQNDQLSLGLSEVFVEDFLEEQVLSQQLLFEVKGVSINIECNSDISAYFDENLIAGVINNILVNCAKYTQDKITITAQKTTDHYLEIAIIDNGRGYPQNIIDNISNFGRSVDFNSGSTNLGLFFSQEIAKLHTNKDRTGSIHISNIEEGGCFKLLIP